MTDGRLWLLRDAYAAQTAWAPRHVGKKLRLSRLGAFDAALAAIRADAEAQAARKTGDHDRATRHEHLAASYRAMRDHYQQQEQALVQATTDRQEWEQATAGSRRFAIAADAELRRRHPDRKIEPLRSAKPAAADEVICGQFHPALDETPIKTANRIRDLGAQYQVSDAEMAEHVGLLVPGGDPIRWEHGGTNPGLRASSLDAILQPPRPEILSVARISELAAERDTEPDHEAAD